MFSKLDLFAKADRVYDNKINVNIELLFNSNNYLTVLLYFKLIT
jgi:hypothetical protein